LLPNSNHQLIEIKVIKQFANLIDSIKLKPTIMKAKIMLLTIFFTGFLVTNRVNGQQHYIKQDSMTFTILSFSYYGYEFLGGHVSYHPLCDNYCEWNEIPIQYQDITWGDFNESNFNYKYTSELLFKAPFGWMGGGWTDPYPEVFWPTDTFPSNPSNDTVPFPQYIKYYTYIVGGITMEEFLLRADTAWKAASTLDIVSEYAQYAHWVGIYCWPYNTQVYPDLDPSTRWIILLYYGNDFITGLSSEQSNQGIFTVYPNPAKDRIQLNFGPDELHLSKTLQLYDGFGRLHRTVELTPGQAEADISGLPQGIYYGLALNREKQLGVFKFVTF
jgi:hypothetical protein